MGVEIGDKGDFVGGERGLEVAILVGEEEWLCGSTLGYLSWGVLKLEIWRQQLLF